MYDFQVKLAAYKAINGLDDEDEITTAEDLDELYSKIKPEQMR